MLSSAGFSKSGTEWNVSNPWLREFFVMVKSPASAPSSVQVRVVEASMSDAP